MLQALLPVLGPIIAKVIGRVLPDKEAQQKAELEIQLELLTHQKELDNAAADIIQAEASSSSWLASSWRPITMLIFVGLIVARWFGLCAVGISEAEYLKLWSIVEFGLGGYVIGRSCEKTLPMITEILKGKK